MNLHHWENLKYKNLGILNAHILDILYILQTDSVNQQSKTVFHNKRQFYNMYHLQFT
jgi:hypothetical protein